MRHLNGRFTVHEHFNGFAVVDEVTGKQAWLGDGVDALFTDTGKALSPGSKGFISRPRPCSDGGPVADAEDAPIGERMELWTVLNVADL